MSIKLVSPSDATMNLGFVELNGKSYAVILHFKSHDGSPREIDAQLKATADVSLKLFQTVLGQCKSTELMNRIDSQGFHLADGTVRSHEDVQSRRAWVEFITHLEHPELAAYHMGSDETDVELVDVSAFDGVDLPRFAHDLYAKIHDASDAERPHLQLTSRERLYLQHIARHKNYPELLAHNFDMNHSQVLTELRLLDLEAHSK